MQEYHMVEFVPLMKRKMVFKEKSKFLISF